MQSTFLTIVLALVCLFNTNLIAQLAPCDTLQIEDFSIYQDKSSYKDIISTLNSNLGVHLPLKDSLLTIKLCPEQSKIFSPIQLSQLVYFASAYYQYEEVDKAKRIFESILPQCSSERYCSNCAEAYNYLGNIANIEDDWVSAYYYFNKLLEWESHNRTALNSSSLLNLGALFMDIDNFEKAENFYQRSLEITSKTNAEQTLEYGWLQFHMGNLKYKQKKYKEAAQYLLAAKERWQEINYPKGACYTNALLGSIYKETKSPETSIQFLEDALPGETFPHTHCKAEFLLMLGELHLEQSQLKRAYSYILASETLAKEGNYQPLLLLIYNSMLAVSFALNDEEKIQHYFTLYKELNEKQSTQLRNHTLQSKGQFEQLIQKERKYNTLKQEEIHNKQRLKNQKIFTLIILSLLIMASLLAYNYFNYHKQTKRKNQQLSTLNQAIHQQQEELIASSKKIKDQKKELEYQLVNKAILNGQFKEVVHKVKEIAKEENFYSQKDRIVKELEYLQTDILQEDLNLQISKSNQDFFHHLSIQYPDLTQSELRLCAFLKLNLTTKEIAKITSKTPDSIKVSRSRLRKKLGLTHQKKAISVFLNQL